ncbi:hypothetical protein FM036_39725 [Nostoc sp. HG1]|nr:hypothetical protein [Nostoc sp. HG1]
MSKIASNSDNKKQLAFFEKISGIDNNLYQAGIESKFTEPKQKEEFKKVSSRMDELCQHSQEQYC